MTWRMIGSLAAALLFGAPGGARVADWRAVAVASATPFIDRANRDWVSAYLAADAKRLSEPYSADAVFIAPDGSAIRGRAAIRAMYARRRSGMKPVAAAIHSDGRAAHTPDDVYEWGTATITVVSGRTVRRRGGRYLTAWHRSGARWLISRNVAF